MLDLITLLIAALVLGALYCGWRSFALLTGWRPAAAWVWSTDYSDAEREDDFWGWGALRGWRLTDGRDQRLIAERVHYDDADGKRHVADIRRYVHRGWRPDGAHIVWYNRAAPDQATAFGPGYWISLTLVLAAGLVTVIDLGWKLRAH